MGWIIGDGIGIVDNYCDIFFFVFWYKYYGNMKCYFGISFDFICLF